MLSMEVIDPQGVASLDSRGCLIGRIYVVEHDVATC